MNPYEDGTRFERTVVKVLSEVREQKARLEGAPVTQMDIHRSSGVSQANISRIFRGDRKLSIEQLFVIAHALDTTASAVVSEAEARLEMGDALGEARVEASGAPGVEGRVVEVYGLEPPSVDDLGVAAKRGSADPYEDIGEESQEGSREEW